MPISFPFPINYLSREQFNSIDPVVMRSARLVHRELGRLLEEHSYEIELAARLSLELSSVITQLPIAVSFGSFLKIFRVDIFADHVIYDLKVVSAITAKHEAYMLHYLMLLDASFGKLLNFGTETLNYRIAINALDAKMRRKFSVEKSKFKPAGPRCQLMAKLVCEMVSDWGLSLDTSLYSEALLHMLGGADHLIKRVKLASSVTDDIGHISLPLIEPEVAYILTTFPHPNQTYVSHLKKIVDRARLKSMHWVNLGRDTIEFITIQNT